MAINQLPSNPNVDDSVSRSLWDWLIKMGAAVNQLIKWVNAYTAPAAFPAGAVNAFAMNTPPEGWLKCNGQTVSRTTYSVLFAAIGTTFGVGDGSTTFALPDFRGEFVRGWADDRSVDTGRTFGSAQADEYKSHTHPVEWNYVGNLMSLNAGATANKYQIPYSASTAGVGELNAQAVGGTETRPRNIALLYCIKY